MTSRELTSGFHVVISVMHLPIKFGAYIFIQSRVIDIFPKSKMTAAAILDFQVMLIWPFRHFDSVVCVLCTKFGSNICTSHRDRRTYLSDLHLTTSRELTSGFNFWSRGHLRIAVMQLCKVPLQCYSWQCHSNLYIFNNNNNNNNLPIKFGADIFIQSGVIDIFPKSKMAAAAILDLLGSHGTTHEGVFMVRTPCKNFVVIGWVVFSLFRLESPIHAPKISVFGGFTPKFRGTLFRPPKCTSLRDFTSFELSRVKIHQRVWPVRESGKKGINK